MNKTSYGLIIAILTTVILADVAISTSMGLTFDQTKTDVLYQGRLWLEQEVYESNTTLKLIENLFVQQYPNDKITASLEPNYNNFVQEILFD